MVRTSVQGPFELKIVDATANAQGFERDFSRRLCNTLRSSSVPLTTDSPVFIAEPHDLAVALAGTWNCLLLIAHGDAATTPTASATFDVAGDSLPWWYASALEVDLADKAIFLCVCEAMNRDSLEVLLGEQLGLILVASKNRLGASEAEAFFAAIFAELSEHSTLSPEQVQLTVRDHNNLTGGQMIVRSAVGIIGE